MRGVSLKVSFCCIMFAIMFSFLLHPLGVYADRNVVEVVETEGACTVYGNDRMTARDNAIDDSMRKAVERVVCKYISENVAIENADVINDKIYSKPEGYIQDYSILKEDMADGLYRVRVRVSLSVGDIKNSLGMVGVLADEWQPEEYITMVVVVIISGIEKYGDFKMFRETLETDIKGVDAVRLRKMGSGVVVMDVDIRGNAAGLARELTLREFGDFSLDLINNDPDVIELNMVKEQMVD
ncbi:MAG: hypothetical protein U9N38_04290 [Thermodesulfobacteriota bacterium]|nr:hypothetical protein [Thermodesulfobacteriota bacterium]